MIKNKILRWFVLAGWLPLCYLAIFGSSNAYALEYGDVVMNSKTESMEKAGVAPVVFPHWFHRIRFKCKVCHENVFIMQQGANDVTMGKIMAGEQCGVCHNGTIAWEALYCERCHNADKIAPDFMQNTGQ